MPPITIDGQQVQEVTIDGQQVQEVTIDGQVAFTVSAIPDSDVLSFEDMTEWTVVNGGQATDRVFSGSHSFFSGADGTNEQAVLSFDSINPSKITYYYQETSNSRGHGVRFYNSNGNNELGTATNNPDFTIDSSSGIQIGVGGNDNVYGVWVEVTHTFYWGSNQVTVNFNRTDGSASAQKTVNLKRGVDISSIELWNFHKDGWGTDSIVGWWDELSITN